MRAVADKTVLWSEGDWSLVRWDTGYRTDTVLQYQLYHKGHFTSGRHHMLIAQRDEKPLICALCGVLVPDELVGFYKMWLWASKGET